MKKNLRFYAPRDRRLPALRQVFVSDSAETKTERSEPRGRGNGAQIMFLFLEKKIAIAAAILDF